MTVKSFLLYLGSLLLFTVASFAFAKQFAAPLKGSGTKLMLYGGFGSLMVSLFAYASTYITDNLFKIFLFLATLFLVFGIIHLLIVHRKYFMPLPEDNTKTFMGEVLFAMTVVLLTIVFFSSLQYFFKYEGKYFLFYPIMISAFTFFIPILVLKTFSAAYNIPAPAYNTWIYPETPISLPEDDPREKLLVIGFEIAKKEADVKKTYFRAKSPENIYLGDLYYFFINDYNDIQSETPLEVKNKSGEVYEWVFQLKTEWYQGHKVLDPYATVKDNGIKENSVIICDRI